MTLGRLKSAVRLLLIGDNEMPDDNDQIIAAIEMAYLQIASQATALKLLTTTQECDIIRLGPGGTYLRMPDLPYGDGDELDIDRELAPAVARVLASYLSRENGGMHNNEANKIIRSYESKVRVFIEEQEAEGAYVDVGVDDGPPQ